MSEDVSSPSPTAAKQDHESSASVPPAVASSGSEPLASPSPATDLPDDTTRSATPTSSPEVQPRIAAPLRSAERYQILGEHGRGGIGRVSRAHDRDLGRDVAIKELISRGRHAEVRFLREALVTARLEHPGIVPVHETGRWPDGTPFYAMKLVSGRPLRDLIAERTTVDQRIALLHHVIAIADAIAYAHGRSIIHRDLKPANVIVGDFGETIVIDWGLAKDLSAAEESAIDGGLSRDSHDRNLTVDGAVLGTPTYMAPEQERGEHVDQRADVFAIGAMLWELCSLHKVPPTDRRHRHHILRRAGIDKDLIVILDKALDPDPSRRYPNAGALAADLKAFKSGARISARSYSFTATLGHWTRRHRGFALSALVIVTVAVVATLLYVRNIAAERDRADTALADARQEARRATIANAKSLLERDPTQAWGAMESLTDPASEVVVLRARIKAAGVAAATILLPARIDQGTDLTPSGNHLVVSTIDRSLYAIDLHTHRIRRLTESLTEPAVFTTTDQDVYLVRRTAQLLLSRISLASAQQEDLVTLTQLPVSLAVDSAGVFWQNVDGTVQQLTPDHSSRTVAEHVLQSIVSGSMLVVCDKVNTLKIGDPDDRLRPIGRCMDTWAFAMAPNGFAVPVDGGHIGLYQNERFQYLNLPPERGALALGLSETGFISAIDRLGYGMFRVPNTNSFQTLRFTQGALGTHARGSSAVWSFRDGSVKVLNAVTGGEWSIKAHARAIRCAYILPPGDSLVTCGLDEIRIWNLPRETPVLAADLPARAFNVAFDSNRTALLDGGDGHVYALRHQASTATFLHKHALLSFGVAWCDGRACSASWDGQILCSSVDSGLTETTATFETSIRWLTGLDGRCFAAVSNGGIYDLRSPNHPIYSHHHEAYRVAFSRDGTHVASTDWGGTIKVWDLSARRLVADLSQLHTGRVNAIWLDRNRLVTAGTDGFVRLLDDTFNVKRSWNLNGPVRHLSGTNDSIIAALADGTIWTISSTSDLQQSLSLGVSFLSWAVSENGALIAAGTDDGELFLINNKHRIAIHRFHQGAITCLAFEDSRTLLACSGSHVMRLSFNSETGTQ